MFVHPWAIAVGIAAVALPFVVHWLTKPRPVRMPLSTLKFVRQSVRNRQARYRLRDFLVLALRTLAILLLALAIARPKWGEQPLVGDSSDDAAARVVILDVSQSMAAVDGGVARMERGRSAAQSYLRYRPGLKANLILAGASPRAVFDRPSQNFDALRDELSAAEARGERLDINQAIELAAEMLAPYAASDAGNVELVVVSDFQRANWAGANFSSLPEQTKIQLETAATDESPANVALLDTQVRSFGAAGGEGELSVTVGNYTPAPRPVTVEVTIDQATFRVEGTCPAQSQATFTQVVKLPTVGWQVGEARLVGVEDALDVDNQRGIATQVRQAPSYALLTRLPAHQRPSSAYFLERALEPLDSARLDPASLDRTALAAADLIVIDHPGKLETEDVGFLAGLLRRGRGMLYVASEPIDATNLAQLSEALGGGLQLPVQFTPPPQANSRSGLFLASYRADDMPFRVFGESVRAITEPLRFGGGLASRRLDDTLEEDLLATYSDGTACLVLTATDAGNLAVLNADLARSNLATSTAFVPLLDQLVERLLEGRDQVVRAAVGEPLVARLPADAGVAESLEVVPRLQADSDESDIARSERGLGEFVGETNGVVWRWNSPEALGVYEVQQGDETVFALTVGVPAEESSLESLPADVLTERLAGGRAMHFRSATGTDNDRDTLWTWLLVACVACILAEFSALTFFRS